MGGLTLASMRSEFPDCRWIAEPGRFLSATTQTAATRVMLTKRGQITLNDGAYGTFSCIPYDHAPIPDSVPLTSEGGIAENLAPYHVFGPSCDGYDIVSATLPVPRDIAVGDWLVFGGMGAYTQASCSEFNGIRRSNERILGPQLQIISSEHIFKSLNGRASINGVWNGNGGVLL